MQSKRRYERHGLAQGATKETFLVCDSVFRSPHTRISPEWSTAAEFTRAVIAEVGLRPQGNEDGRWILVPVVDYLELNLGAGDDFDPERWFFGEDSSMTARVWNGLPHVIQIGIVFRPGFIRWEWVPFKRRVRHKRTDRLPTAFQKSEWPRSDDAERKRAKRDYRRKLRAEQEAQRVTIEQLPSPAVDV